MLLTKTSGLSVCLSVCVSVCLSVCVCVCPHDCGEMAGLSNTVLHEGITYDNSSAIYPDTIFVTNSKTFCQYCSTLSVCKIDVFGLVHSSLAITTAQSKHKNTSLILKSKIQHLPRKKPTKRQNCFTFHHKADIYIELKR